MTDVSSNLKPAKQSLIIVYSWWGEVVVIACGERYSAEAGAPDRLLEAQHDHSLLFSQSIRVYMLKKPEKALVVFTMSGVYCLYIAKL